MADYKLNTDKIKELLNTPPALGVKIEQIASEVVSRMDKEKEEYICECLLRCNIDPDAFMKTAKKNKELMDTLADIYSRIESGKLIELPCKVGDKVWCIYDVSNPIELQITILSLSEHHYSFFAESKSGVYKHYCDKDAVGKWVFFTREEAEEALAKMKGGE